MKSAPAEGLTTLTPPKLKKGEILIGAFIKPDGHSHWTVLLPGDKDGINWKDALAWAKKQGGDLPDRIEQASLFANHRAEFKRDWYWSNAQLAGDASYAWYQGFHWGGQSYYGNVSYELRARAVRRVPI